MINLSKIPQPVPAALQNYPIRFGAQSGTTPELEEKVNTLKGLLSNTPEVDVMPGAYYKGTGQGAKREAAIFITFSRYEFQSGESRRRQALPKLIQDANLQADTTIANGYRLNNTLVIINTAPEIPKQMR